MLPFLLGDYKKSNYMAIILSIETSTPTSSIAIHDSGNLVSSQSVHRNKSHSEHLIPSIKYLCETSGINIKDIGAVAISKGPGSYTGLRIGTSSAKGLCYGLDIKLIAVNTLEAMAYGMQKYFAEEVMLCPMLDARRMEVYCLVMKNDLSVVESTQAKIIEDSAFEELLETSKIVFFGNGAHKCKGMINSNNAIFIDDIYPSAIQIGELAWDKYVNNQFEELAYFEPFYLKDFIAKKPSRKNLV
jgi:tRNA threonylcarbamoyladenosine biosynthesis protein TsaB